MACSIAHFISVPIATSPGCERGPTPPMTISPAGVAAVLGDAAWVAAGEADDAADDGVTDAPPLPQAATSRTAIAPMATTRRSPCG